MAWEDLSLDFFFIRVTWHSSDTIVGGLNNTSVIRIMFLIFDYAIYSFGKKNIDSSINS